MLGVCVFIEDILAQLSVDGEHLRVTHKGKGQDGNCVGSLQTGSRISNKGLNYIDFKTAIHCNYN